jgi:5'-deoxynucleotidase YfbR-like HD superfamily hydrolase
VKDLRTLSHVPRWSILRVIHRQSVADHMYYVSFYASQIAISEELSNSEIAELLMFCITHDIPEVITSDIPGPIKRKVCHNEMLQIIEEEGMSERFGFAISPIGPKLRHIAKVADLLDEICYLFEEN